MRFKKLFPLVFKMRTYFFLKRKAWRTIKRINAKMHGKTVVHILHIGKTGGSALKDALGNYVENEFYCVFLHSHGVRLIDIKHGEKVIFFLRNPIDRFVSAFYGRMREDRPRYYYPWSLAEKKAFEKFSTPNQLASALSSINNKERTQAIEAMCGIGHIKQPYTYWLERCDYLETRRDDIFFVGFQETLPNDFENMKSLLKLPNTMQLPEDDLKSHKSPGIYDKSLSDIAIHNLKTWFQNDIDLYNWCFNNYQMP